VRVLPILVADDVEQAIRCVTTLAENGLPAVEITLRTPNALNVLREVVNACPGVTVGAGTILTAAQLDAVKKRVRLWHQPRHYTGTGQSRSRIWSAIFSRYRWCQ
jgi:hypothetical protein